MSVQNKTTLKSYFEAGDKPTQSQFANLIDSLAHVTELPNGIPLSEPIPVDESITVSDIGKLAMLDYDGNIKVYHADGSEGVVLKMKLTFNDVSEPDLPFQFEDANGEIDITTSAWLTGVTTPEEEAAAFMDYINTNHGDVWLITAAEEDNEVYMEQVSPAAITQFPSGLTNISSEAITVPMPPNFGKPKKICIGVIKNVNETNHTVVFDDVIVLQKADAPNITAVLAEVQALNDEAHYLALLKLVAVPTTGGLVRAVTDEELEDEDWVQTCVHNALYFFLKPHADTNKFYCIKRAFN